MNKYIIAAAVIAVALIVSWSLWPSAKDIVGYAYNDTKTITLSATSTADNVQNFDVRGKKDLTIAVVGTNATATVKFAGSITTVAGNPLSTVSATNQWGYVDVVDLIGGASLAGATGLGLGSGTTSKMYKLTNVNLSYLTPVISAYTTGTVSVMLISDEGSNR